MQKQDERNPRWKHWIGSQGNTDSALMTCNLGTATRVICSELSILMTSVFFEPWEGCYYSTRGILSKKTLVLGESYYHRPNDKQLSAKSTIEFIEAQIKDEWKMLYFTSIVRVFCDINGQITPQEKSDFWHSVLHYVFVQECVGKAARERPTEPMWNDGKALFEEILKKYRPEFVLVLGRELWSHLPPGEKGPLIQGARYVETVKYKLDSESNALAYGIPHPSSGRFSANYWRPYVANAMNLA